MTAIENILVGQHTQMSVMWVESILHTPHFTTEEQKALEKAYELLEFIGLSDLADTPALNLPYGAQRRLEIARALASEPIVLMLDEPTAGMNPQETAEMMAFIKELRDSKKITIVLIEHDMRVVMGISELIYVLDYGRKIAEGNPEEIQSNQNVIEAYLGPSIIEMES